VKISELGSIATWDCSNSNCRK